jgi:5-methylcytosine-specific restriction endonuclease McrA
MSEKVAKSELLDDYKRLADDLGKTPTKREYNQEGNYSETVIYNYYDSIGGLKSDLGFDPSQTRISEDALIEDVQRVFEVVDRVPRVEDYREHGEYDEKTVKSRLGNWSRVLETAGFEPTDHSQHWKDNDPNPHGERSTVTKICDSCGGETEVHKYDAERNELQFCDNHCQGDYYSELTGEDALAWEGGNVEIECEICDDTREVVPARADSVRFCSYECLGEAHKEARSGEDSPLWKDETESRYYGPNWPEQRQKARERDNHECQVCDMDRREHYERYGAKHDVHHIIRFNEFDDYEVANRLGNLITLCKPHHAAAEWDKINIEEYTHAE